MNDSPRLTINEWPEEERPREKLRDHGPSVLTNAELLAILIGSGTPKKSAVDLMKEVLQDCDQNLNTLGRLSIADLTRYSGIGEAKAITIIAASELGRRRAREVQGEKKPLLSSDDIYEYMRTYLEDETVENAWLLLMNNGFRPIKHVLLSKGGITETAVDIRLAMREAIISGATVVVLCHNHPSGNLHPSRQDDQLTQQMQQACGYMRITLADHIIISPDGYYSYRDEGKL